MHRENPALGDERVPPRPLTLRVASPPCSAPGMSHTHNLPSPSMPGRLPDGHDTSLVLGVGSRVPLLALLGERLWHLLGLNW